MNTKKKTSATNINKRVFDYLAKENIKPSELARLLGLAQSSIYVFFESNRCDVDRLYEISKALNYNFLAELGRELGVEKPTDPVIEPLKQKIADYEKEIAHWKETVRIMSGK